MPLTDKILFHRDMATEEEFRLIHDVSYIEAVKQAGHGQLSEEMQKIMD